MVTEMRYEYGMLKECTIEFSTPQRGFHEEMGNNQIHKIVI